jgi:hypothetical protein
MSINKKALFFLLQVLCISSDHNIDINFAIITYQRYGFIHFKNISSDTSNCTLTILAGMILGWCPYKVVQKVPVCCKYMSSRQVKEFVKCNLKKSPCLKVTNLAGMILGWCPYKVVQKVPVCCKYMSSRQVKEFVKCNLKKSPCLKVHN